MKKILPKLSTNILLSPIIAGGVAYYLLVSDNCIHCSISYIINYAHTLAIKEHLLVVAALPIYIATVIFGSALLGITLSNRIEKFFARSRKKKLTKNSFQAKFERQT
jgi:hypothetical protein